MTRYDQYKDSGVQWLGEIPAHWKVSKIKRLCNSIYAGGTPSSSQLKYWNGDIPWIPSGCCHDCNVDSAPAYITQLGYNSSSTKLIPANTAIMAMTGATCSQVGYLTFEACANQSVVAYNVNRRKILSRFVFYLLQSMRSYILTFQTGGAQGGINVNDCKNLIIPHIPLIEQDAIVAYLDSEVSKIDEAIKQQQKMIELLNERRQIIISEAVTKGLNPDVQMKDSGIDWVGVIPEHWEVRRLKTLMYVRDERNDNPDEMLLSVYTALGVRPRKELEERGNKASTVINYKKVRRGDLIVNRLLAWMGAYGLSDYQGVTSPDYDVYCFNSTCFNPYYELMFRNSRFKGDCFKYGHGIMLMRWRTYPSEFLNIKVPYPPYDEQVLIYGALRPEIDKISLQIEQREKIIKRLSERKRIIINDVVTGKVKVS